MGGGVIGGERRRKGNWCGGGGRGEIKGSRRDKEGEHWGELGAKYGEKGHRGLWR